MAQIINNFIKGKMNKDLDDRLIPNGEYRNAINTQVSKSEGNSVGALENALGNILVDRADFRAITLVNDLVSVGYFTDETTNSIYVFLTNYRDPNPNRRTYNKDAKHSIWVYNTLSNISSLLTQGAFLNFSLTNPITGVNVVENLLFWTDNRNQPRKLNIDRAIGSKGTYYYTEEQVSVAKYNPYKTIELWQESAGSTGAVPYETTMKDVTSKFLPGGGTAFTATVLTNPVQTFALETLTITGDIPTGDNIAYIDPTSGIMVPLASVVVSYGQNNPGYNNLVVNGAIGGGVFAAAGIELVFNYNPYYINNYNGDEDYLRDRFARFSYRFRFDDGEYSIFSTFTQPAFIPKQDGYFMYNVKNGLTSNVPEMDVQDEEDAFRSTIVDFMENKVNRIDLRIPLPDTNLNLQNNLHVQSMDILYKESDGLSVAVLDTIDIDTIFQSAATCTVFANVASNKVVVTTSTILGGINVGDVVTGFGVTPGTTVVSVVPNSSATTTDVFVSVAQSIPVATVITIGETDIYTYQYQSRKPYKVLPEDELIRVYDKTPVRALSQEIISNRVVYGNFQDKHTPPKTLDYNVAVNAKGTFELNGGSATVNNGPYATGTTTLTITNDKGTIIVGSIVSGDGIPAGTIVSGITGAVGSPSAITLTNGTNAIIATGGLLFFKPGGDIQNRTSIIEYPNSSLKTNRTYQVGIVLSDYFGRQSTVILSQEGESVQVGSQNFVGSTIFSPYNLANVNPRTWPGNALKVLFNTTISPSAASPLTNAPGIYNGDQTSADFNPLGWYSFKVVVKQQEQEYYNVYLPGVMAAYPTNATLELGKTSHAVLINDNINKVPRDLSEVGPDQKQYRSSVALNGRVQNLNAFNNAPGGWNNQYYPGNTTTIVSTIATNNELFNGENLLNYVPSPQFYNVDSNPLIARISTQKQFGLQFNPVTAFVALAGTTASATVSLYGMELGNIAAVASLQGFQVAGFGIPTGTFVGANPTLVSISLVDSGNQPTPVILPLNTVLSFTPPSTAVIADEVGFASIKRLAVYETNPVTSLLDIFWESSTTGLITDLNNAILDLDSASFLIGGWNPSFQESNTSGSVIVAGFYLVDNFGVQVPYVAQDPLQLTLTSVSNLNGEEFSTLAGNETGFELVNLANGLYNIKINRTFFFAYNDDLNDFTFFFEANVGNPNIIQTTIQRQAILQNVDPVISSCPGTLAWNVATSDPTTAITTVYAKNGSAVDGVIGANSQQQQDLLWELTATTNSGNTPITCLQDGGASVLPSGSSDLPFFSITSTGNANNGLPANIFVLSDNVTPGSYSIKAQAIDAGPGEEDCVFTINVTDDNCVEFVVPGGNIPSVIDPTTGEALVGQVNFTDCAGGETGVSNVNLNGGPGFSQCGDNTAGATITYIAPDTGTQVVINLVVAGPCT